MSQTMKILKVVRMPALALLIAPLCTPAAVSAERPTLKHNTRDPRPDILPHPAYDAHVEHRRAYNRPTYLGGWIAYKISRTSQEAMVWEENLRMGNYAEKHMPPMYKRYYAPKPWEVLNTRPRPDFPEASVAKRPAPARLPQTENPVQETAPLDLSRETDGAGS